jgi:hypothetical protein
LKLTDTSCAPGSSAAGCAVTHVSAPPSSARRAGSTTRAPLATCVRAHAKAGGGAPASSAAAAASARAKNMEEANTVSALGPWRGPARGSDSVTSGCG